MRRLLLPLLTVPALALAACGHAGHHAAATPAAGKPSGSVAGEVSAAGPFPAATGGFGDKPTLAFTSSPAATLQRKILSPGTGPAVGKGDLISVNYLGQIWGGNVFDTSYGKQPIAFPIGTGKVIPGWDTGLVGVRAGSRVMLTIPPADGYGTSGQPQAGIKGTDTLVFVVDVLGTYGARAGADPAAVPQTPPAHAAIVTGKIGQQPTVHIPAGLPAVKKPTVFVLAKGHGAPVRDGDLIVQYQVQTWNDKVAGSTWQAGDPTDITVGASSGPSAGPFTGLVGVPLGSRVLVELPAPAGQAVATGAVAVALDLIGEPAAK